MSKKKLVSIVAIVVVLIAGVALFRSRIQPTLASSGKQSGANATSNKVAVKVIKPKEMSQSAGTAYKATLDANQEGIVSPQISGKVVSVLFDNGRQVTQGGELVILDDQALKNQLKSAESQLEVSKAALQKAEANLENAQRTYDRTKALIEQGAAAQVDLDNAETSLKMNQADMASSQAGIQAAQANIDNLNTQIAETIIRAPISGLMDGKNVSLGQFVAPGNVLGKVEDISKLDAVIEIDQAQIQNVQAGQKAQVILNGDETKTFDGVVKTIASSADSASRAFKVQIELDNKNLSLRPGVSAKVTLVNDALTRNFVIPVALISGNEGNYFVYINDQGIARKRAVTVGNLTNDQVEITSGLKGNEEIISTNLNTLQDGDAVTVVAE